ncbi:uncharacterized protein PV06_07240 [Exophiala oligosperma]|uniref:Glutathione S-transferase n=1 Tax=Exophiala oligosperma TaxID=215243 RepID=A0A0D2DH18_9EURO|nr:uncharacterized protein PV06_07240 [Exophiala oligosperma]KIW41710.1 hypothetical protein PV06_07240 [Exophiala oligosperma]
MASGLKPLTLWGKSGPNPPKVATLLEELGLPYEIIDIPFADVKKPEYTAINPNGRLPTIKDPNNNDILIWESGAIIEYLLEKYDTEHKFGFAPGTSDFYHARQYLFYQVSGQGPYFGQYSWFKKFHPEKLPSATERYLGEMKRISGVLEGLLKAQTGKHGGGDGPWLVGNKYSYADLAFLSYYVIMPLVTPKEDFDLAEFPVIHDWLKRMLAREPVKAGFKKMSVPIEQVLT